MAAAAVADSTDPAKITQALTTPEAHEAAVAGTERVARCGAGGKGNGAGGQTDGPCPVQAAIVDGRIEWISSEAVR